MAKVLVSLNAGLLRRVDRTARSLGLSRSPYLAQIAESDLARLSSGTAHARRRALARLDALFADPPAGDATAFVRAARDAR